MSTRLITRMLELTRLSLPPSNPHIPNGTPSQQNLSTSRLRLILSAKTPSSTSQELSYSTRSIKDHRPFILLFSLQTRLVWPPLPPNRLEKLTADLAPIQSVVQIFQKCKQFKQVLSHSLNWSHSMVRLGLSRLVRLLPLPTLETTQLSSRFPSTGSLNWYLSYQPQFQRRRQHTSRPCTTR